jgi:pimeloyl-ACP methyl ester carboxylesterase
MRRGREAAPVRHSIRARAGITLAADRYGAGSEEPPIVLLHGGGQTRHSWDAAAERLAGAGREVWAVDLRGHGESDWAADGDYSTRAMAEDIVDVCGHIGRRPVAVGASMGGMAALVSEGIYHPGQLHALVLVDIATMLEEEGVDRIVGFMSSAPDGFASLEEAADSIAAYRPGRPRPTDLGGLRKNLRRGHDGRWRWHWDPAFLADKSRSARRDPGELGRAAANLRLPTLLIRGRLSDMVSEEGAALFLEQCPHARYVDVADATHMVVGDRNDVFVSAVIDFLDQLTADAEEAS